MVGVAQEKTSVWRGWRDGGPDGHPHFEYRRQSVFPNNYYFYIRDPDWGPGFIKTVAYAPFSVWVYLNGNEWAKHQAAKQGIAFDALDNGSRPAMTRPRSPGSARASRRRMCARSSTAGRPGSRRRSPSRTVSVATGMRSPAASSRSVWTGCAGRSRRGWVLLPASSPRLTPVADRTALPAREAAPVCRRQAHRGQGSHLRVRTSGQGVQAWRRHGRIPGWDAGDPEASRPGATRARARARDQGTRNARSPDGRRTVATIRIHSLQL